MKSTFTYKKHPNYQDVQIIEADVVQFVPGFVLFLKVNKLRPDGYPDSANSVLLMAEHTDSCFELREVPNEKEET